MQTPLPALSMADHHRLLIIITLFTATAVRLSGAVKPPCNADDRRVLFKIKEALGNPYELTTWIPDTDCCYWYVAKCNRTTGRINKLLFITGGLDGNIPAEVGELPYLEHLYFHKSANLTGGIPSSIAGLKRLQFLVLSWNNLSGPIPAFLSRIKTLEYLELSFNRFSGSIPPELASLPNLRSLLLDHNQLTGTIPTAFGSFNIYALYLSHNKLTGSIPASFSNLNFTFIDLSRNKLTGTALPLLDGARSAYKIDISRNEFEFDFSKAGFPDGLGWLDINHNNIYGGFPEPITKVELQFLNVSYNRLCGPIPQGGTLPEMDSTVFFHNRCLCGKPLNVTCKSGNV